MNDHLKPVKVPYGYGRLMKTGSQPKGDQPKTVTILLPNGITVNLDVSQGQTYQIGWSSSVTTYFFE